MFQVAFNAGRMDMLLDLYEPGAILAHPGRDPVIGREAIRAAHAPYVGNGLTMALGKVTIAETEHGLALVIATWSSKGNDAEGHPRRLFGTARIVIRRQPDGSWKYLIDDPGVGHVGAPD